MSHLDLFFDGGGQDFKVSSFTLAAAISTPWSLTVTALLAEADLDLEALLGVSCGLKVLLPDWAASGQEEMYWTGTCSSAELVRAEPRGLSTYRLDIAPTLWLLSLRTEHRVFQRMSGLDMALAILKEWNITPTNKVQGAQQVLDYRVQLGEDDLSFVSRLLEEAGISYFFVQVDNATSLVLSDSPQAADVHGSAIPYYDDVTARPTGSFATRLRRQANTRQGKVTLRGYDFRRPRYKLDASSQAYPPHEMAERYDYLEQAGAAIVDSDKKDTPAADTPSAVRQVLENVQSTADRRIERLRTDDKAAYFESNVFDLAPGHVTSVSGHPRNDFAGGSRLLVTGLRLEGSSRGEWRHQSKVVFAANPYRPPQPPAKPRALGVQSAVVVGPQGEEIHTDEFGRVRVQFHWDRRGPFNEQSSCWVRVSQGWSGTGFGMFQLPRVGQEVLVAFVDGDPDQPVVVGRLHNAEQPVPYTLPANKTVSTWKSSSSPGGDGFNEIKFEDSKENELVYVQAQRDLQKLVKRNETEQTNGARSMTVDKNLSIRVKQDESEVIDGSRTTQIGGKSTLYVKKDSDILVDGQTKLTVGGGLDIVAKKHKREWVKADSHLKIDGDYKEKVSGGNSLSVGGDEQLKAGGKILAEAGTEVHIKAGTDLVLEGVSSVTLKGPGGFVVIDAGGVTIKGTLVKINSGGSAGSGSDPQPASPDEAEEASPPGGGSGSDSGKTT